MTLQEIARQQAVRYASKTALRFGATAVSYAQLHDRSQCVAAGLLATGLRPGDRVAYFGKNSSEYYEILIGTARAGMVLVPINWRLTDRESAWQLQDCNAKLLFLGDGFEERAHTLQTLASTLDIVIYMGGEERAFASKSYTRWRDEAPMELLSPDMSNPEDVVVQLYTSGTTGHPKGAMLSHRALLRFRNIPPELQPKWNSWNDDDVGMIVMPQFHIGGTGFGLQILCAGATGLVVREFDAGQVLDAIEKDGLSKLFTVPSALQMMVDHPRVREIDYGRIRTIVYGASPIRPELLHEAMDIFQCGFVQQYGMTETCGTICVLTPDDHLLGDVELLTSAGRALDDVEILIVDDERQPLPRGSVGEIAIKTPTIMTGYWNLAEATNEAFIGDGFFLSGDAGYIDDHGYLFIRDRVKDMIVSGGENVYPAEVESVLARHPAIAEVAVIGVPDRRWGETVKAVVALRPGAVLESATLINWARSHLAGYKLPKSIEIVEALPRNATGKVLRRVLRDSHIHAGAA